MTDYSNGADGCCVECGEETAEGWHLYCARCYARQEGWERPDKPGDDPDLPPVVSASFSDARWVRLMTRVAELERRVDQLEHERRTVA